MHDNATYERELPLPKIALSISVIAAGRLINCTTAGQGHVTKPQCRRRGSVKRKPVALVKLACPCYNFRIFLYACLYFVYPTEQHSYIRTKGKNPPAKLAWKMTSHFQYYYPILPLAVVINKRLESSEGHEQRNFHINLSGSATYALPSELRPVVNCLVYRTYDQMSGSFTVTSPPEE